MYTYNFNKVRCYQKESQSIKTRLDQAARESTERNFPNGRAPFPNAILKYVV